MDIVFVLILAALGLVAGSFAGATVWRLRAKQLDIDSDKSNKHIKKEREMLKPLVGQGILRDRSICLNCSKKLKWFDMIPIFSWLYTRGRCRQCGKRIGWLEPLVELFVAVVFVGSFLFWPYQIIGPVEWLLFAVWLLGVVGLAIIFIYDYKWFLIPDKVSFVIMGLGLANLVLVGYSSPDLGDTLLNATLSLVIMSGIYAALYVASKGRWIGFGDVKLGIGLALLLVDWELAFIALFAANLIGTIIVAPMIVAKKMKRSTKVPFGPLLILGTVFAKLFGFFILDFYLASFLG